MEAIQSLATSDRAAEADTRHCNAAEGLSLTITYYDICAARRSPRRLDLGALPSDLRVHDLTTLVARAIQQGVQEGPTSQSSAPLLLPRLFFSGVELEEQGSTLAEVGLRSGAILSATPRSPTHVLEVRHLLPPSCLETGGATVHIEGRGFQASQVRPLTARFGGSCVPLIVERDDLARCVAPPHPPGVVSVEVSSNGHQWTRNNVLFTYTAQGAPCSELLAVPSLHCSSLASVQELEKIALRHSRGF